MLIENLFLSAGAMKCGTTWLYSVLDRHPELYFSYEKEVHYFAHLHTSQIKLDDRTRLSKFKQAIQNVDIERARAEGVRRKALWYGNYLSDPINDMWYANLFSLRRTQKYCADFSNLYCHLDADGWDHVKAVGRNVKVIYLLRDPIARLWSHVRFHLHVTGRFSDLEKWTQDDFRNFAGKPFIWSNGEYSKAIERLRASLTEDQLRIAFIEDIHRDARQWLGKLETFLGINHFEFPEDILRRRVNESPSAPMPEFFPGLFADYVERETSSLKALGFDPGSRWVKAG